MTENVVPKAEFGPDRVIDTPISEAAFVGGSLLGNPRNESVRMGSLVSRAQLSAVRDGLGDTLAPKGRAHLRSVLDRLTITGYEHTTVTCACGNVIETRSTVKNIQVEICSACHPFFTGKQKLVDTAGRIERFNRKYGIKSAETK